MNILISEGRGIIKQKIEQNMVDVGYLARNKRW